MMMRGGGLEGRRFDFFFIYLNKDYQRIKSLENVNNFAIKLLNMQEIYGFALLL